VSLRAWILGLAGTSFLAGVAAGLLLGANLQPPPAERGAYSDYEALLVRDFELSPLRHRALRGILDRYHREVENVKSRNLEESEGELADLGLTYRRWIRDKVLSPDQRMEFDRLAAGGPR